MKPRLGRKKILSLNLHCTELLVSDWSLTIKLHIIHVSSIHTLIKNNTLITCKLHLEKLTYYSGRPEKVNRSDTNIYGWLMCFSFGLNGLRILLSGNYTDMKKISLIPLFFYTSSLMLHGSLSDKQVIVGHLYSILYIQHKCHNGY